MNNIIELLNILNKAPMPLMVLQTLECVLNDNVLASEMNDFNPDDIEDFFVDKAIILKNIEVLILNYKTVYPKVIKLATFLQEKFIFTQPQYTQSSIYQSIRNILLSNDINLIFKISFANLIWFFERCPIIDTNARNNAAIAIATCIKIILESGNEEAIQALERTTVKGHPILPAQTSSPADANNNNNRISDNELLKRVESIRSKYHSKTNNLNQIFLNDGSSLFTNNESRLKAIQMLLTKRVTTHTNALIPHIGWYLDYIYQRAQNNPQATLNELYQSINLIMKSDNKKLIARIPVRYLSMYMESASGISASKISNILKKGSLAQIISITKYLQNFLYIHPNENLIERIRNVLKSDCVEAISKLIECDMRINMFAMKIIDWYFSLKNNNSNTIRERIYDFNKNSILSEKERAEFIFQFLQFNQPNDNIAIIQDTNLPVTLKENLIRRFIAQNLSQPQNTTSSFYESGLTHFTAAPNISSLIFNNPDNNNYQQNNNSNRGM